MLDAYFQSYANCPRISRILRILKSTWSASLKSRLYPTWLSSSKHGISLSNVIGDADVVLLEPKLVPFALPWLLSAALRKHPPRYVVREDSPPVETGNLYYRLIFHHFSLQLSCLSDALFAISPMRAEEIHRQCQVSKSKIHVWPSSVDSDLFNPSSYATDREAIREELSVGKRYLLVYHGVLSRERGLCELVEALQIVRKELAKTLHYFY